MTTSTPTPSPTPILRSITLPLIRKRSEHNSGLVSTLEELALHQEELQSIGPVLGRTCGKTLKILLLQNNVIERLEYNEMKFFRSLEYVNLALNNLTTLGDSGLSGMEWLKKLDVTLNFLDVDCLRESVGELEGCGRLEEVFLIGNPCMGVDLNAGGQEDGRGTTTASASAATKGWSGCRPYIIARLPNLKFLDGKEIKRSERIAALQKLPELSMELDLLAEKRRAERRLQQQRSNNEGSNDCNTDEDEVDESYILQNRTTHHNPTTRTKLSNEMYDQKQAKEKQETSNAVPHKGEKEWEEEHRGVVEKVREREERGREFEKQQQLQQQLQNNYGSVEFDVDYTNELTKDGGIKQCNQGKHRFWFEDSSPSKSNSSKDGGILTMKIAIPKYLSTSLVDVDIHPTYVSVVIKSKILRVILPVEVISDKAVARRSASSGYLELVMPKVDPDEKVIGLGFVRGGAKSASEKDSDGAERGANEAKKKAVEKKERIGLSILKEGGAIHSLNIVQDEAVACGGNIEDEEEDEPPPLF
jgi:protein TilB